MGDKPNKNRTYITFDKWCKLDFENKGENDWQGLNMWLYLGSRCYNLTLGVHKYPVGVIDIGEHDHGGSWLFSLTLAGRYYDYQVSRGRSLFRYPGSCSLYRPQDRHSIYKNFGSTAWSLLVWFKSESRAD